MKANDMLNKIKTIIGGIELTEEVREIELAEMKLQNGTVVEAEEFKKGEAIFIKSDDERIAMPVGEYVLEDGKLLVVEEEGIIADMRDVSDDVPAKEEDMKKDIKEEMAEEAAVYDWEGMEKRIKNLEDAIADLKEDKVDAPEDVEATEELSEETNEEVKSELSKEEIKENVDVELSAEVAEPVKHNPEASNESKFTLNKTNYPQTLQQRIYEKLNN
tara:strand:+ start:9982 stop:10632 length:651 start_codon:yes stop_codon:yes gene_type:complete